MYTTFLTYRDPPHGFVLIETKLVHYASLMATAFPLRTELPTRGGAVGGAVDVPNDKMWTGQSRW